MAYDEKKEGLLSSYEMRNALNDAGTTIVMNFTIIFITPRTVQTLDTSFW